MNLIKSLGKRVDIYHDATPDIAAILLEERAGIHMDGVQEESEKREDMAVLGEPSLLRLHVAHATSQLTFDSLRD
jgi:hypothetical protein